MREYILADKSKTVFLHKDHVHSTSRMDSLAGFIDYFDANDYAKTHNLAFKPMRYDELKRKKR